MKISRTKRIKINIAIKYFPFYESYFHFSMHCPLPLSIVQNSPPDGRAGNDSPSPRTTKYRSYISAKKLLKLVEVVEFGEQERVFDIFWE